MAQRTIVLLTDDIDGSEAQDTVVFGLDGREYEIDLNEANEAKLREALEPFLKAARKRSGGPGQKAAATAPKSRGGNAFGVNPQEAREWAKANGYEVNDRGRVPAPILEAYKQAHA